MKWVKPVINGVIRAIVLIIIPVLLVKYLNEYFSYLGVNIAYYGLWVIIAGSLYILFKFLEEYIENPKYKLLFGMIALTFVLLWTYYLLNRGVFRIPINGVLVTIDYKMVLWILIFLIALRYPQIFMMYYSEVQRYSRRKRVQSSGGESL